MLSEPTIEREKTLPTLQKPLPKPSALPGKFEIFEKFLKNFSHSKTVFNYAESKKWTEFWATEKTRRQSVQ